MMLNILPLTYHASLSILPVTPRCPLNTCRYPVRHLWRPPSCETYKPHSCCVIRSAGSSGTNLSGMIHTALAAGQSLEYLTKTHELENVDLALQLLLRLAVALGRPRFTTNLPNLPSIREPLPRTSRPRQRRLGSPAFTPTSREYEEPSHGNVFV